MPYTTPEEALRARLAADSGVNTACGGRINPQVNTQEITLPVVIFKRLGGAPQIRLNGSNGGIGEFTFQVDVYAETESGGASLGNLVRAALFPAGGWQDISNGVWGCFPDDSNVEFTDDPWRQWTQIIRLFWKG